MKLVVPAREHLASYVGALERGWSPDNLRAKAAAEEQLAWIARDALILPGGGTGRGTVTAPLPERSGRSRTGR